MLEAVIFDMDGVIIDSEPFHLEVNLEIFKRLDINMTIEEYNTYIGTANTEMWADIKAGHNLSQSVPELVAMQLGDTLSYLAASQEKPIPGIVELLTSLKENNISIALASSSPVELIEMVLKIFNIRQFFDEIVSGEDMERSKPAPDIFLHTAKMLNAARKNCVVIEDSKNGVIAAKRAGMKCIGFNNPNSGGQDISGADLIVERIIDITMDELKRLCS